MPIISNSGYSRRPFYMLNAHLETIIPSMFFKLKEDLYERERLELDDGDFLDLDWIKTGHKKCLIISHGLEGSSDRFYVKRTAKYFENREWDIAAWNCRSCSGEMNRLPRFYHHGDTADLAVIVNHVLEQGYQEVALFGYSMGGSLLLKYLGERSPDDRIKAGVSFSVPCNLRDSAEQLLKKENRKYEQRFLKKLVEKIKIKAKQHIEVSDERIEYLPDFDAFHDRYTAPLHGFESKEDFFEKATCDSHLHQISIPVLIVNAANDPMLGEPCYPKEIAGKSSFVYLEIPKVGGHCGFTITGKPYSYMELRADEFLQEQVTAPDH